MHDGAETSNRGTTYCNKQYCNKKHVYKILAISQTGSDIYHDPLVHEYLTFHAQVYETYI